MAAAREQALSDLLTEAAKNDVTIHSGKEAEQYLDFAARQIGTVLTSMSTEIEEIPASVLAKHPEMVQISQALAAFREGREVVVQCPTCGGFLHVTDKPEIGSLWITCETGCISYHLRYSPAETPKVAA